MRCGASASQGRPIYSAQAVRFVFSCAEPLRDGGTDPTFPANFAAALPGALAPEPDQAPSCSGSGGSPNNGADAAGFVSDDTAARTQAIDWQHSHLLLSCLTLQGRMVITTRATRRRSRR